MKRYVMLFGIFILLVSCAHSGNQRTLDQVKSNLDCIAYTNQMDWMAVRANLGSPDVAPIPGPEGGLSQNTRVYRNKSIIFHTRLEKVKEGDKDRFQEVVAHIEICKEK